MIFSITAIGNYSADIGSAANSAQQAPLTGLLDELCNERFRRINRFTQLALIGSARCAKQAMLTEQTGLYIGSGLGSITNTISVQQQVVRDRKIPKPADFINTLSNSAGYYVARNLGLQGQNLFVSRGQASMDAAFQLAMTDLLAGIVESALVGIVDECTTPLSEHVRRLKLDPNAHLAESSLWFLIQPKRTDHSNCTIRASITLHNADELSGWLRQQTDSNTFKVYLSPDAKRLLRDRMNFANRFNPHLAHYPCQTAGALIKFIESEQNGELLTISSDDFERLHITHVISS